MDDYYTAYYINQTGGGGGSGGNNEQNQFLQLKFPRVYQRGRGVGSIFSNLWKFLQPLLRSGASFVSKELMETGSDIVNGISTQKPIKSILADRSIKIVDKIRDKAADKIKSMAGSGSKRKQSNRKSIKAPPKKKQCHYVARHHPMKNNKLSNKKKLANHCRILDIFS